MTMLTSSKEMQREVTWSDDGSQARLNAETLYVGPLSLMLKKQKKAIVTPN